MKLCEDSKKKLQKRPHRPEEQADGPVTQKLHLQMNFDRGWVVCISLSTAVGNCQLPVRPTWGASCAACAPFSLGQQQPYRELQKSGLTEIG